MSALECLEHSEWSKQMSERWEQTSKRMSKWPTGKCTYIWILGCSEPKCTRQNFLVISTSLHWNNKGEKNNWEELISRESRSPWGNFFQVCTTHRFAPCASRNQKYFSFSNSHPSFTILIRNDFPSTGYPRFTRPKSNGNLLLTNAEFWSFQVISFN